MSDLKDTTVIDGLFNGIEIKFKVGDCQRINGCIKVHHMQNTDDQHPSEVLPGTISLDDGRLALLDVPKKQLRGYFNAGRTVLIATEVNTDRRKKKKTVKMNPGRRV